MKFIKKYRGYIIFSLGGALAGFLYYFFIGCASGACAITSNPYISTFYGLVMGFLIANIFTGSKKKNESPPPEQGNA